MDTILGIIAFIFVLGLIIMIHEGGHFFFARRVNILCREFSFGMGPLLFSKKKGETQYSLRAFPIGGYCAIAGEEEEADPLKDLKEVRLEIVDGIVKGIYLAEAVNQSFPMYEIVNYDLFDEKDTGNLFITVLVNQEEVTYKVDEKAMIYDKKIAIQNAPHNRTLNAKRKRDRAMVMFGGPLMNFVLALVVFLIAGLIQGAPDYKSNMITDVAEGTPVYEAGLRNGDKIIHLSSSDLDMDIIKWDDISLFMDSYSLESINQPIIISYEREGEIKKATVLPYTICYSGGFSSDYTLIGLLSKISNLEDNSKIIKLTSDTLVKDLLVEGNGYYYTYTKENGIGYTKDESLFDQSFNKAIEFVNEYLIRGLKTPIKVTYKVGNETKENEISPSDLFYEDNGEFTSVKFFIGTYSEYNSKIGVNVDLKRDDIIVKVNGNDVKSIKDIYNVFNDYIGDDKELINLDVYREGEVKNINIQPYSKKLMEAQASTNGDSYPSIKNIIGVSPTYKFNLLQAFVYSGKRTLNSATVVFKTLGLLFTGGVTIKEMSGPVGIFSLTKAAAKEGFVSVLNLTGLLSVNIGIMNLLPIPALDGGRLVFVAYEAITKKKPNEKVETILITVTMILLIGLMIYITFGDVRNIISSSRG